MRRWIWPCHSVTWAVRNPRSQAEASRVSSFPRRLVSVPHLFQGQGATVTALGPDTTGEKSPGLLSSWLEGNKCALKGLKGAARPPVRTAQYHSHVRRILSWCQRSLRFANHLSNPTTDEPLWILDKCKFGGRSCARQPP